MSKTVEHNTWLQIRRRCYDQKCPDYPDYGGRGVKVYGPWRRSFEAFFKAMGRRPKGRSIDRIDNSKGYMPGNVRWATKIEQARNKRNTTFVTYKGRKHPLRTLAEKFGIGICTLRARLKKLSIEEALTRPLQAGRAWE